MELEYIKNIHVYLKMPFKLYFHLNFFGPKKVENIDKPFIKYYQ
jgi:hypothetical protein